MGLSCLRCLIGIRQGLGVSIWDKLDESKAALARIGFRVSDATTRYN